MKSLGFRSAVWREGKKLVRGWVPILRFDFASIIFAKPNIRAVQVVKPAKVAPKAAPEAGKQ